MPTQVDSSEAFDKEVKKAKSQIPNSLESEVDRLISQLEQDARPGAKRVRRIGL